MANCIQENLVLLSVERFVSQQQELLKLERESEIEETRSLHENVPIRELQKLGLGLSKLSVTNKHTGLFGRTVIKLESIFPGKELPSHTMSAGDIVCISQDTVVQANNDQDNTGLVYRVSPTSISVAIDNAESELNASNSIQWNVFKLANDVTYKRLKKCLDNLNRYESSHASSANLVNVLFGQSEISLPMDLDKLDISFFNDRLDQSQKEAVTFALCQREVAIVHGPPGTGKTTTLIEIIRQAVKLRLKILACAPSNIAVDNIVERLADTGTRLVRLGHPARALASIQKYSLDAILGASDGKSLVRDVRSDIDNILADRKRWGNPKTRQGAKGELKSLRAELREREAAAIKEVITGSQVILSTLTSATDDGPLKHIDTDYFDLVIIDECSQAIELACWIPLLKAPRCIIAGDHKQLPPTIISDKAARDGLAVSLMERLMGLHGDKATRMLTIQYRMHEAIMQWSSQQFYSGKLEAHESVKSHLLKDLPDIKNTEITSVPLLMIDTAGSYLYELETLDSMSKGNQGEADLVTHHVKQLVDCGVAQSEIAVIAPYNLQVELLRIRLSEKYPKIEIKSVDGFQGREKDAVVLTLVRSNTRGEVGFLAEDRRINVAVTRARRHVAIICDSETVSHDSAIKTLVDFVSDNGEVWSAEQLIHDGALSGEVSQTQAAQDKHLLQKQATGKSTGKRGTGDDKPKERKKKVPKSAKSQTRQQANNTTGEISAPITAGAASQEIPDDEKHKDEEIIKELDDFLDNAGHQILEFASTLTARQRFVVHEFAEKHKLGHESQGQGSDRHIVVKKPVNCKKQVDKVNPAVEDPNIRPNMPKSQEKTAAVSDKQVTDKMPGHTFCQKCDKYVPEQNYDLHVLRCVRISTSANQRNQEQLQSSGAAKSKKKSAAGKAAKAKKGKSMPVENEEDFDDLIAAAMKDNNSCHFKKCKNSVACLGQICAFCQKRFCLSHCVPESHGCVEDARRDARARISHEGVLYPGSGAPSKKPDPTRRAHLEKKLNKKLDDMAEKRHTKKKGSK